MLLYNLELTGNFKFNTIYLSTVGLTPAMLFKSCLTRMSLPTESLPLVPCFHRNYYSKRFSVVVLIYFGNYNNFIWHRFKMSQKRL